MVRQRFGKYEIQKSLGSGKMGEVFLARDTELGREVAIKVILKELLKEKDTLERFKREAKAAAKLNHPNVVTVHDLGQEDDVHYIVMEYVKGHNLQKCIAGNILSRKEYLEVLAQVCEGLGAVHKEGLTHRDIKPANIMVIKEGEMLRAKVMDFGIARPESSNLTETGGRPSTPSYCAPEYLRGNKPDTRYDIFSTGVVLYECLSGRKPFTGDPAQVTYRIAHTEMDPFDTGAFTDISPKVIDIIEKVLQKEPADRYQTAKEFGEDLRAAKDPKWTGFFGTKQESLLPPPVIPAEEEDDHDETTPSTLKQRVRQVIPTEVCPDELMPIKIKKPKPEPTANQAMAEEHYKKGNVFFERKDYDTAILEYSDAIKLDPNYASAYCKRGSACLCKKDYDGAIADYTQAIRIDPDDYWNYKSRADAYEKKGNTAAAKAGREMFHKLNKTTAQPNSSKGWKAGAYLRLMASLVLVAAVIYAGLKIQKPENTADGATKETIKPVPPSPNRALPEEHDKKGIAISDAASPAGTGVTQPRDTTRSTPANFVLISGGTFTMGSPASEAGRIGSEAQHQVTVSSFYMRKYQVTQAEYQELIGTNPSHFKGHNLPVESVTWYDAVFYCNRLSQREGLTSAYTINGENVTWNSSANGYRLPTEAEWEYACRAGTTTPFSTGYNITTNQANYNGNYPYNNNAKGRYREQTTPVGSFAPNSWSLYDMHGNVWEWCWDWYGAYSVAPQTDPVGASSGTSRVLRGGSWGSHGRGVRSAIRSHDTPSYRYYFVGFRVVRSQY